MGLCSISLLYAIVICLGSLLIGFISAYTSPAGQKIREIHNLKDTDFQWSFYGSIAFLGAAFGPFFTKFLFYVFKSKRKNTLFVISVISLCSWLLNCVTKINIYGGWVARLILGITMGSYSSMCAMYLVEISPEGYSGFYGSLNQIAIFVGQALVSFLGPFVNYMNFNYLSAAICLVLAISVWFIPESPIVHEDDHLVEKSHPSIFQKKYVKGILIGFVYMFMNQFTGINGIITNLADIFRSAGLDLNPNYQSGIAILSLLISCCVSSALVDKIGRKLVWLISSCISFVGTFIMSLNEKFDWSTILPLICIFIFGLGFGMGLGPIPWYMVLELFDPDVREIGNTICVVSNWMFAFIIVMVFPEMKKSMGIFGVMLLFAIICVLAFLFGLFIIKDKQNDLSQEDEGSIENTEGNSVSY